MNQHDIMEKLKYKTRMSTAESKNALKALKEIIYEALENGEKIQLLGFGTFDTKERKARQGTNPRTKQPMFIPASKVPYLKPGKEFKDRIQGIKK